MTSRHEVDTQRKRQRDSSERDGKMQPPPNRAPAVPQGANRMHEYFVSKDGIDREVITADICRYLGNDALVRPGTYENPTTGQVQNGFFIKAYRNLTNAMIEDLKLDSARWENERRAAPTGRPVNGTSQRDSGGLRSSNAQTAPSYLQSQTHESRQYYGHNEGPPQPQVFSSQGPPPDRYMSDAPYASMQSQSGSYVQPQPGFDPRPPGNFPIHNEPPRGGEGYYVSAGTHYDSRTHGGRLPASQVESIPRGEASYAHGGSGPYQPQDTRFSSGYPSQVPVSSAPPFAASQQDPYYNSRPPQQEYHQDTPMGGAYQDSRPMYNEQPMYSNTGPSSSGPLNPSISSTANSSRSRDTHRSDDRRRDHRDHRDDRHRR